MYIIGIDPDSEKHGIAIYDENGTLINCKTDTTIKIVSVIIPLIKGINEEIHFSIEDVNSQNFIYGRNEKKNKNVERKVGMGVAKCQQAQIELIRWLEHYGITYELHKPQSGNWAKNKAVFQSVTGWKGRSSEDARSAAYFGYLALNKVKK